MTYRFFEHTAELGLEIEATSLEDLLSEATLAFAELIRTAERGKPANKLVEIAVVDEETILADWLNELVFLADTEAFVPDRLIKLEHSDEILRGELEGVEGAPRPLVKAATYHGLEVRKNQRGVWEARVVFDV